MKIDCEKLNPEDREVLVEKLELFLVLGDVKLDGAVICISDNAQISMGNYFKVCNLLMSYGVNVED